MANACFKIEVCFPIGVEVEVEVDFATTVSRPVRLGVGHLNHILIL
jgi:hypothetical protein